MEGILEPTVEVCAMVERRRDQGRRRLDGERMVGSRVGRLCPGKGKKEKKSKGMG